MSEFFSRTLGLDGSMVFQEKGSGCIYCEVFPPINVRARCGSLLEDLSGVVGKPFIPNSGRHDDT